MSVKIAFIDGPEVLILCAAAKRMGPRTDDAHLAPEDIEELWELVKRGTAKNVSDTGDAVISTGR